MNPGAETITVTLHRNDSNEPWGFRLNGGIDFTTPLSISQVRINLNFGFIAREFLQVSYVQTWKALWKMDVFGIFVLLAPLSKLLWSDGMLCFLKWSEWMAKPEKLENDSVHTTLKWFKRTNFNGLKVFYLRTKSILSNCQVSRDILLTFHVNRWLQKHVVKIFAIRTCKHGWMCQKPGTYFSVHPATRFLIIITQQEDFSQLILKGQEEKSFKIIFQGSWLSA